MTKLIEDISQKGHLKSVVLDEFSQYSPFRNDGLKQRIRSLEGIPADVYQVLGKNRVFVFDKLVSLTLGYQEKVRRAATDEEIRSLLPGAIMLPYEAVANENIKPEGYSIERTDGSTWGIRLEPFDALLLASFASKDAACKALANILVNESVETSGSGDFVFKQMQFKTHASWGLDSLPEKPTLEAWQLDDFYGYRALARTQFREGFPLVTEDQFNSLRELEKQWSSESEIAKRWAKSEINKIWSLVDHFGLDSLNNPLDEVDESSRDDAKKLKAIYPELGMLSEESLFDWFGSFQSECCYCRGWMAYRDDDFVFYLMGKQLNQKTDDRAVDLGQMLAYGIMLGEAYNEAKIRALQWFAYDDALRSMAWRTAQAMAYLDQYAHSDAGHRVSILSDVMNVGRKYSVSPVMVEQTLEDFSECPSS